MIENSNKACFSCFNRMILQETRDKRQETRDILRTGFFVGADHRIRPVSGRMIIRPYGGIYA